jgi:hypothetical protein
MILKLAAKTFSVETEHDPDFPPWHMQDYMPVSDWERRDKKPSELVVNTDNGSKRFFDFAACVVQFKKDGVSGADAAKYARENYERVRSWCNGRWFYMGVIVTDTESGKATSLWGIESDSGEDFIKETVLDLARELLGPNLYLPGFEPELAWEDS